MERTEVIEKAKQANSPEELLVLAKENNVTLSEEEAKKYFEKLHQSGELSDEELENVAGGGCNETTVWCPFCGGNYVAKIEQGKYTVCTNCHRMNGQIR